MHSPFPSADAKCPACCVPLETTDRQCVRVDHCPQCLGLWLDRGALDRLLASSGAAQQTSPAPPPPRELGGGGGWLGHFQPSSPDRGFGRKPVRVSPYVQVD
ncbi:zf-TFIIB domain-containing protein [Novosphingobium aquae]|uniref:Zf-TFIIB domain-containing protein n=1 Tax=Novosphingobium aquae TaxID=3133435 RepID=A0ABU8SDG7_9SPHN